MSLKLNGPKHLQTWKSAFSKELKKHNNSIMDSVSIILRRSDLNKSLGKKIYKKLKC